jgi:hypothetical protein
MSDKSISTSSTPSSLNGDGMGASKGASASSSSLARGANPAETVSLKDDVKSLRSDVKGIAADVGREAQKLAESRLDSGKGVVAEGIGSVAGALRNTGDQLRESPVSGVSGYLGSAADSIQDASKYLENKSVSEVISDVESLARREPLLFLGGSLAVGMLIGRFLKAAAPSDRDRDRDRDGRFRDEQRFDGPSGRGHDRGFRTERFDAGSTAGRQDSRYTDQQRPRDGYRGTPPASYESRPGVDSSGLAGGSMSVGATMGGSTTGGNMGAGKLPSILSPNTPDPTTNGTLTTGPVSTSSSVGTDLPVKTPSSSSSSSSSSSTSSSATNGGGKKHDA